MDALNRLQLHILQDEARERWHSFQDNVRSLLTRKRENRVGISLTEANHESEGRVWVEVGNEGLRLRVTHLHPANPSVSEALRRKCTERREDQLLGKENSVLQGKLIYPPQDDKISLSSLEDYWFNHWQGPFITADNNQNNYSSSKLRRSHRKSKRSSRCSICQKKLVRAEQEEKSEIPCMEREESILAHMPTVKIDTRLTKDDLEDKSDDDVSKSSINEDTLSRISASDEHLSRMHRVVDNEMRTSFSLFVEEAVSTDVTDAAVSMDTSDLLDPSGNTRFLVPPITPRQSRSCPCSPKLSKTYSSPESVTNSPKSRSIYGISKFSLSASLLALHRQASSTLMPEFLKFDTGKSDSPGASKANSQHNSLRAEARKVRHTLSDATQRCRDDCSRAESHFSQNEEGNLYTKSALHESLSLPPLKLSKMSLTYRGGVIISEEKELSHRESLEDISEHGACAIPSIQVDKPISDEEEEEEETEVDFTAKSTLPDIVPITENDHFEKKEDKSDPSSPPGLDSSCVGVINLGFDGSGESSDFVETTENENLRARDGSKGEFSELTADNNSNKDEEVLLSKSDSPDSGTNTFDEKSNLKEDTLGVESQNPTLPLDELAEEENHNTFIEKDVMQEAREMVFWWRKSTLTTAEESEFCLHETECKVKQKPLLMFLHGIGSSADVWNQQLWYFLSCGYEIVAPDLLGHGLSSAPRDKKYYRFSQMLDYISLVFDLFVPQGRKCIVIGHNYGCALAVALARGRPMSVGLVILCSCGGPSPLVPHTKYEIALSTTVTHFLNPFISCGCLSRELLYTPRGKHYPTVASDKTGIPSTPRYVVEFTSQGQNWPEGDMAFHRRITIPALLLYGMKDNLVSFVEMCEMEKTIPRAFLELIPGAGHELQTDCAEEVCHAMHRFIRRWKHNI